MNVENFILEEFRNSARYNEIYWKFLTKLYFRHNNDDKNIYIAETPTI